jgi:hypothetical protein
MMMAVVVPIVVAVTVPIMIVAVTSQHLQRQRQGQ